MTETQQRHLHYYELHHLTNEQLTMVGVGALLLAMAQSEALKDIGRKLVRRGYQWLLNNGYQYAVRHCQMKL